MKFSEAADICCSTNKSFRRTKWVTDCTIKFTTQGLTYDGVSFSTFLLYPEDYQATDWEVCRSKCKYSDVEIYTKFLYDDREYIKIPHTTLDGVTINAAGCYNSALFLPDDEVEQE